MNCKNHPALAAMDRCVGCAESFCQNCLVEVQGQHYCASCKVMAIKGPPAMDEGDAPCKEANEALTYAILSLFCCGIILGPVAISKAVAAKKVIQADARLAGSAKANIAVIIASLALALWVINLLARAKNGLHAR